MKSRKLKEQFRKIIRRATNGGTAKDIKYIDNDYWYWIARQAHKHLKPKTPDEFYLCR